MYYLFFGFYYFDYLYSSNYILCALFRPEVSYHVISFLREIRSLLSLTICDFLLANSQEREYKFFSRTLPRLQTR